MSSARPPLPVAVTESVLPFSAEARVERQASSKTSQLLAACEPFQAGLCIRH